MIAVSDALYDFLVADSTLTTLLGHTSEDKRIVRAQQATQPSIPSVVFQQITHAKVIEGKAEPRTIAFNLITYAEGDRVADAIAERLIALLHEADISSSSVHCYTATWDDLKEGPFWSVEEECFRVDTRFIFAVRKKST